MWEPADSKLSGMLGITGATLGILIVSGILRQCFSTHYDAMVDRFRGMTREYWGAALLTAGCQQVSGRLVYFWQMNSGGAWRIPKTNGTVVSIDGQRAALAAILRGERGTTVESTPRFGPLAFDTLERYLAGEGVPPRILLSDRLFDASNAGEYLDDAYE